MNKYGIWIVPESNSHQELKDIVEIYSKKYNSPLFDPHMSLHGVVFSTDEEVVEIVKGIAEETKPFTLEIGEVEFSTTYFQSIFARIKTNAHL